MIILLLSVLWVFLAWFAAARLIVATPLDHADAIVVLSGSATYAERAQKAAALYHGGISRKIILTNDNRQGGWSTTEQRNPYYYERTRAELLRAGVSAADITVLSDPVYSTYDEAVLLRGQSEKLGVQSMTVVTSAYHSRRARWIMESTFKGTQMKIGIDPVAPGSQTPTPATWWLHFRGWEDVPMEYLKMVEFWLK
jgi:uncharacterized SAM-binding protein YcdF (DUF218 family)